MAQHNSTRPGMFRTETDTADGRFTIYWNDYTNRYHVVQYTIDDGRTRATIHGRTEDKEDAFQIRHMAIEKARKMRYEI